MLRCKSIARSLGMAIGMAAVLANGPASAAGKPAVYGTRQVLTVEVDREAFRAEIESYIRSINQELKLTLLGDLKALPPPEVQLAAAKNPARG